MALISVVDKVHNIHLPALENLSDKAKKELFKNDGIHLTRAGLTALEDNLIQGIKSVYTDIKETDKPTSQQEHGAGRQVPRGHGPGRPGTGGHGNGGGYRPRDRDSHAGGGGDGYTRRHNDNQPRQHSRDWRGNNNRQMYNVQNMMREFMMFMDNGPNRFRGRGRY